MQVVFDLLQEIVVQVSRRLIDALLLGFVPHGVDHHFLARLVEEGRNHPDCQHVVDELQKPFLRHVGISEEEHGFLGAQLFVQELQVLSELLLLVPSGQADLKEVVAGGVGRQSGQRLFSGPAHSH